MKTVIGVIGVSDSTVEQYKIAENTGIEIAKRNGIIICGGLGGVMEAVCKGAKSLGGLTIGIMPGFDRHEKNQYVDIPIVTGMSNARNIILVRSSQSIISIGRGYGTLSEIAFALKLRIPIIGINTWEVSKDIKHVKTPKEAVDMAFCLAGGCN